MKCTADRIVIDLWDIKIKYDLFVGKEYNQNFNESDTQRKEGINEAKKLLYRCNYLGGSGCTACTESENKTLKTWLNYSEHHNKQKQK